MGFHCVAQTGLKFLGTSDPLAFASQSAEITDVSYHIQSASPTFYGVFWSYILKQMQNDPPK
uniref:Uncharacterized protein n=1 Tax=Prolemur simus TaxID=1328070 RepID=A0A8C9DJ44_PROSS